MVEVDRSVQSDLTEKQQLRAELAALRLSASTPQLDHDDGADSDKVPRLPLRSSGGNDGGMEARIARLESDMGHVLGTLADMNSRIGKVEDRLTIVQVDVATVKENVRHLPSKVWIGTVMAGMLSALAVVVGVIVRFLPHAS